MQEITPRARQSSVSRITRKIAWNPKEQEPKATGRLQIWISTNMYITKQILKTKQKTSSAIPIVTLKCFGRISTACLVIVTRRLTVVSREKLNPGIVKTTCMTQRKCLIVFETQISHNDNLSHGDERPQLLKERQQTLVWVAQQPTTLTGQTIGIPHNV